MMVVLVMSWAMIVNIAKLLRDRIMMQNAVDNAAYSAAVYRARTLNLIGQLNELMASTLAAGAFPALVPVPLYSCSFVGGSPPKLPYPFCDYCCRGGLGEYHVDYGGVVRLRSIVNRIRQFQKGLVAAYVPVSVRLVREVGRRQEANAAGEYTGADVTVVVPGHMASSVIRKISGGGSSPSLTDTLSSASPEKLLGLRRIGQKITYYKTINIGIWYFGHHHFVLPRQWCKDDVAWYRMDNSFHQQKLIAIAVKKPQSPSNRGYPWFGRFIGLSSWPPIITVAAAAVYNTAGPMFPDTDDSCTGIRWELLIPSLAFTNIQLSEMRILALKLAAIPFIGQGLSVTIKITTETVRLVALAATAQALSDTTPVSAYEKARSGGWDAHLVPVGEAGLRH